MAAPIDVDSLSLFHLKEELDKRGASTDGNRFELQDRLKPLVEEDAKHGAKLYHGETFWQISVNAKTVTFHWGHVDREGSTRTRDFDSVDEARKFVDEQIVSKKKHGYDVKADAAGKRPADGSVSPRPKRSAAPAADAADAPAATAAAAAPASAAPAAAPAVAAAAAGAAAGVVRVVPDAKGVLGVVDPQSGLADKGVVYISGGEIYDFMLNQIDLAQNMDKYYVGQVIHVISEPAFYCFTHWGRTGTTGQTKIDKFADADSAIKEFKDKFFEKTANSYDEKDKFVKHDGKYDLLKTDYHHLASKKKAKWQYYIDKPVDGKVPGWYDYDAIASDVVESVHDSFVSNPSLGIRCVQSGMWMYQVDLSSMTQTNIQHHAHTKRDIRRVEL